MNTHAILLNSGEANKQSRRDQDVRLDLEDQFAGSVRVSLGRLETRPMNPRTSWKDGVLLMKSSRRAGSMSPKKVPVSTQPQFVGLDHAAIHFQLIRR
jgi:hypothetical protein